MAFASDLPASRTIRPISEGMLASSRSAARSRQSARASTGVAAQIGAAPTAFDRAAAICASVASTVVPTMSRRSAGLRTSCTAPSPVPSTSASIGAARHDGFALARSADDSDASRCSFDRSRPSNWPAHCRTARAARGSSSAARRAERSPTLRRPGRRRARRARCSRRQCGSRTRCSRRSRAGAARGRPAASRACRPAHRSGTAG